MSWESGRPIYDRLPGASELYKKDNTDSDNYNPTKDVAAWLVAFWDDLLIEQRSNVDNLYRDVFNPDTAKPENLDWLAQLAGYTGEYWSSQWTDTQKRQLIKRAYDYVWINKGTKALLEWLIELFELDAVVYSPGQFILGETPLGSPLGGEPFKYLINVDFRGAGYLRTSPQWKLLEKLNELYGTAYSESRVQYTKFILGFSALGDSL